MSPTDFQTRPENNMYAPRVDNLASKNVHTIYDSKKRMLAEKMHWIIPSHDFMTFCREKKKQLPERQVLKIHDKRPKENKVIILSPHLKMKIVEIH